MITDADNTFLHKQTLSASTITSDVVSVGTGEASDPMTLVVLVANGSTGGTLSTVLETSATEDFKTSKTLGTYTEVPLSTRIPRGNLGYLRIKATSTYTAGTVTAALVFDDEIR